MGYEDFKLIANLKFKIAMVKPGHMVCVTIVVTGSSCSFAMDLKRE